MSEPQQHNMRRLGIIDLMIVTTSVALVFMLYETANRNAGPPPASWLYYTNLLPGVMTLSLVLPAIYWIPVHYFRTGEMFSQPGHWMLGAQLFVSIWSIGFYAAYILLETTDSGIKTFFSIAFFFGAGSQLAATIISTIASIKLNEVRWKIASVLLAVYFITQGLGNAFRGIMTLDAFQMFDTLYRWSMTVKFLTHVIVVISFISITTAVLVDWKSKVSRDWLHWVGLTSTLAALAAIPLVEILCQPFLPF